MEEKSIKGKHVNSGIIELFEIKDSFGKIIEYSIIKSHFEKNAISCAAKMKKKIFQQKKDAIDFFNNQN